MSFQERVALSFSIQGRLAVGISHHGEDLSALSYIIHIISCRINV